ncbi:hypothetical protein BJX65DRAFT_36897 [Aspergillus insuetus]
MVAPSSSKVGKHERKERTRSLFLPVSFKVRSVVAPSFIRIQFKLRKERPTTPCVSLVASTDPDEEKLPSHERKLLATFKTEAIQVPYRHWICIVYGFDADAEATRRTQNPKTYHDPQGRCSGELAGRFKVTHQTAIWRGQRAEHSRGMEDDKVTRAERYFLAIPVCLLTIPQMMRRV